MAAQRPKVSLCAVEVQGRNVEMPVGIQAPTEPLELSNAGHLGL